MPKLELTIINSSSTNKGQKPLFRLPLYGDTLMLYDTGSDVAVFTKSEEDLFDLFPDAAKIEQKFLIIRLGKEGIISDVYKIPQFIISDEIGNRFSINNFHVALTKRPDIDIGLILPGHIFADADVVMSRKNGRISLYINYEEKERGMGVRKRQLSKEEIKLLTKAGYHNLENIITNTYCFTNY